MTTIATGNRRLLKLAGILDKADAQHCKNKEPTYDQTALAHDCGTPACALGHYVYAHPRKFSRANFIKWGATQYHRSDTGSGFEDIKIEFALCVGEYYELFGTTGCNWAKTAKQAAKYIRNFVKQRAA